MKKIGTIVKIKKNSFSINGNEGVVGIVLNTNYLKQHEVYCTNGKTYWLLREMFEVLSEV
jgi:hypothetical protein